MCDDAIEILEKRRRAELLGHLELFLGSLKAEDTVEGVDAHLVIVWATSHEIPSLLEEFHAVWFKFEGAALVALIALVSDH